MAKAKPQTVKFDRINRNQLKLKNSSKRTRTGAYKAPNRKKAH